MAVAGGGWYVLASIGQERLVVVTIGHVAARAGVSKATVSRVVNGSSAVTSSTRRKVETAIASLRYQPSVRARDLSLGVNPTVVVLASEASRTNAEAVVRHLSDVGLQPLVVEVSRSGEANRAAAGVVGGVGAVVAVGGDAEAALEELEVGSAAVVSTQPGSLAVTRVVIDDSVALSEAARALGVDTDAAVLLDDGGWSNSRVADARALFAEHGIRLQRPMRQRNLAVLFGRRDRPRAIVATSPALGILSYHQALGLGLGVPHDLAIVTVGSSPATDAVAMSAIVPPLDEAAAAVSSTVVGAMRCGTTWGIEVRLWSRFVAGVTTPRPQSSRAI